MVGPKKPNPSYGGSADNPRKSPSTSGEPTVHYRLNDGIAVITLNRPHRLNAVSPELVDELCYALDRVILDDACAAILTGTGRAFCAGHDLKQDPRDTTEDLQLQRLQRLQDVTRKIRAAPCPVIAAVRGYALGAGCEFALGCDLIVAADDAIFGFPEVAVGLSVTGGISQILPATVGLAKAKEMVLRGEYFHASEAARLGMINRIVESDQMQEEAWGLARELSQRPRKALALAKNVLDRSSQAAVDAAYDLEVANALALRGTADAQLAARDFQNRSARRHTVERQG